MTLDAKENPEMTRYAPNFRSRLAHLRMKRLRLVAAMMALLVACAACSSGASSSGKADDNPYSAKLTYWFWGESDVPGITNWMQGRIQSYEKLHPGVSINLVPQATETLQGTFQTAAQSQSGPDIATQWATLPVLTPAWEGQVTPLTGLVPQSQMQDWLNNAENTYQNKVWAMPIYLLGVPFVWNKALFKRAGLDSANGPQTWTELLQDCGKLKAAGITPIMIGDTDGAFGSWLQSTAGIQSLNSISELKDLYAGKASFSNPEYSGYLTKLAELKKNGCINSNVSSISANEAWQEFAQQKGAMTWTTDGNVASWIKAGLSSVLGVETTPVAGSGKLAAYYDSTQSSSAFITSWSTHKRAAAAFLSWLHQPSNLDSLYQTTGAFPADKRFSASEISQPILRKLYELDSGPQQIWAENYAPPQVDSQGLRPAGQAILAGSTTPAQAIAQIKLVMWQWKAQQVSQFQKYTQWAK